MKTFATLVSAQGPIGIIGGGAFGTALAVSYASGGHDVVLWVRRTEQAESLRHNRVNTAYLPDIHLPDGVIVTTQLADLNVCRTVLLVTPAQATRDMVTHLRAALSTPIPLVLCSKGIEVGTHALLHDIVHDIWPDCPTAYLSGPSFAADIARQRPTALTLACADTSLGRDLAALLTLPHLRLYRSNDMIGTAIGGAVKNVLAIACGIATGLDLGDSARAALVTRGLAELARLNTAMGGQRETLFGLCGIGDIILTCTSMQSRNFSLGQLIGAGESAASVLQERTSVTEGVHTAQAVADLAMMRQVDLPITQAVHAVLQGHIRPREALNTLLLRPMADEMQS
ncbi:MAG: NAD(P)H-dependent glycerol-3-phosphate dehydrogenase [Pseudomonadota bacterium]